MLTESILKVGVSAFVAYLKSLPTSDVIASPRAEDIEAAISSHQRFVQGWSRTVSFADLKASRATSDIFVPIDILLYPKRLRVEAHEAIPTASLMETVATTTTHLVILGHPGAGKTTSLKRIARLLLETEDYLPACQFPLVVPLRVLNPLRTGSSSSLPGASHTPSSQGLYPGSGEKPGRLFRHLFELLGLTAIHKPGTEPSLASIQRDVGVLLEHLRPMVMLDGLDELAPDVKKDVVRDIGTLSALLEPGRLCVTSRTGDSSLEIQNAAQYELAPLTRAQMAEFADKWLGPPRATTFVHAVLGSPFADTAIRPLTLAHLCAIYERTQSLPAKPKTVYRKVVGLLLTEWDEQRGVQRRTSYEELTVDRQLDFLCQLAFSLTTEYHASAFTEQQLVLAYFSVARHFRLDATEAREVFRQLEEHTGLLVRSGYDSFEFVHKSIQEHLTAEHLVRLPAIPEPQVVRHLPSECAVAVALSSDPAGYLAELCLRRVLALIDIGAFVPSFVGRLALERPDLVPTEELVLALVVLYSLSRTGFQLTSELEPTAATETAEVLEALLAPMSRVIGARCLEPYYQWAGTDAARGWIQFRRELPGHVEPHVAWQSRLPSRLFLPLAWAGT